MRSIVFCLQCGAMFRFSCVGHMHVCFCGSLQFTAPPLALRGEEPTNEGSSTT